ALGHRVTLFKRNIPHTHLARGGDIANHAALQRIQRIEMMMRESFKRVREFQETTREIRPRIALQLENYRFGAPMNPNLPAHNAFLAVIDLAAHNAVMDSEGHSFNSSEPQPLKPIPHFLEMEIDGAEFFQFAVLEML